jgi:hypothetical protein
MLHKPENNNTLHMGSTERCRSPPCYKIWHKNLTFPKFIIIIIIIIISAIIRLYIQQGKYSGILADTVELISCHILKHWRMLFFLVLWISQYFSQATLLIANYIRRWKYKYQRKVLLHAWDIVYSIFNITICTCWIFKQRIALNVGINGFCAVIKEC